MQKWKEIECQGKEKKGRGQLGVTLSPHLETAAPNNLDRLTPLLEY
jgi:hypothetical protein